MITLSTTSSIELPYGHNALVLDYSNVASFLISHMLRLRGSFSIGKKCRPMCTDRPIVKAEIINFGLG
jgi:hypothetical protein